jgi:hypothetical protein
MEWLEVVSFHEPEIRYKLDASSTRFMVMNNLIGTASTLIGGGMAHSILCSMLMYAGNQTRLNISLAMGMIIVHSISRTDHGN